MLCVYHIAPYNLHFRKKTYHFYKQISIAQGYIMLRVIAIFPMEFKMATTIFFTILR